MLFGVSIPFPEGRANTRRIRTIAAELASQNVQVTMLLPFGRDPGARTTTIDGYRVERCCMPSDTRSFLKSNGRIKFSVQIFSRLKWLCQIIRHSMQRGKYDWLYLYQPGIDGVCAGLIARITGHRVVSEYVDLLSPTPFKGFGLRVVYSTLFLSDYLAPRISNLILVISTVLERRYSNIAPQVPILLLPTLVEGASFRNGNARRFVTLLGLQGKKLVVYTGSFAKPQGVANLIYAFSRLTRDYPEARLILAGGGIGDDCDDVPRLIEQYGMKSHIILLGSVPQQDVIDLQAAADVLVMPKLDDPVNHAGLSTKLAEYLASGTPVVASAVGDVSYYLQHDHDALLCRPGDIDDLQHCVGRILADKALAEKIGLAGQQKANEVFDVSKNVSRLVEKMVATQTH